MTKSKKRFQKDRELKKLNELKFGYPACAFIDQEQGVNPDSCLTPAQRNRTEGKKKLKTVEQTHEDREQHYEIDGVSLVPDHVVVGSEAD